MAGLKKLSTRIINKHATAAVWNTKKNFIPLQAETIVYDPGYDSTDGVTYDYPRHKIGDGTHNVTELPFVDQPKAVVTQLKKTANIVTSVTQPTYTSSQYVAPSMGQSYSKQLLLTVGPILLLNLLKVPLLQIKLDMLRMLLLMFNMIQ